MTVKKTFNIDDENAAKLRKLADERGCTATDVLNAAIRAYGSEPYGSHTDSHTVPHTVPRGDSVASEAVSALVGQLAAKDAQIAQLMDALAASQEATAEANRTAQAAQALHAQERVTIEAKQSRWKRLLDAWRG